MKNLRLPKFDIPDLPSKKISPRVAIRLIVRNVRRLRETGLYEVLQQYPDRRPVNVRFVLK